MKYEAADFRYGMREAIKEVGRWLTDNADKIVPDVDRISSMSIMINFDPNMDMLLPTIDVDYRWLTCGEARERFYARLNGGEG